MIHSHAGATEAKKVIVEGVRSGVQSFTKDATIYVMLTIAAAIGMATKDILFPASVRIDTPKPPPAVPAPPVSVPSQAQASSSLTKDVEQICSQRTRHIKLQSDWMQAQNACVSQFKQTETQQR